MSLLSELGSSVEQSVGYVSVSVCVCVFLHLPLLVQPGRLALQEGQLLLSEGQLLGCVIQFPGQLLVGRLQLDVLCSALLLLAVQIPTLALQLGRPRRGRGETVSAGSKVIFINKVGSILETFGGELFRIIIEHFVTVSLSLSLLSIFSQSEPHPKPQSYLASMSVPCVFHACSMRVPCVFR